MLVLYISLHGCSGAIDKKAAFDSIEADSGRGLASVIKGVPFFPQKELMCGPASLADVLNYYGMKTSLEEVSKGVYRPELKGTLSIDMLLYAKDKGFEADFYSGGIEDLKKRVRDGTPPILFLNLGFASYPIGHYIVVTGFSDPDGVVIVHSGLERDKVMSYKELAGAWSKTGFSTLLITPRR
ncbi:MAG: C39 family peptidase [Deltaproteobacteria bacterium]|nr:C39 family peptidase [Deltaproteobacteria bacterium]